MPMNLCLSRRLRIAVGALSLGLLAAQSGPPLPFGTWHHLTDAPVLSPTGNGWQSAGTFNPAVVTRGDTVIMLYRAQGKQGTSRLGYAESADGIHFKRREEPVLSPTESYEKNGGVEDPRLVQFGDTYYLTYTGYNKSDAQLCLAEAAVEALGPGDILVMDLGGERRVAVDPPDRESGAVHEGAGRDLAALGDQVAVHGTGPSHLSDDFELVADAETGQRGRDVISAGGIDPAGG